ncbi:MAG: hydroxylamine reductase, partial [Acidaminococcaceae bacterium]
MKDMFCFQCEQTAGSVGCMGKAGVCGKQASTANLQDDLTGAMIGLAQTAELGKPTDATTKVMLEGLFTTITNVNFDDEVLQKRIADVHREKALLGVKADFPDYKMWDLWDANEDVRSLKSLILLGLRG